MTTHSPDKPCISLDERSGPRLMTVVEYDNLVSLRALWTRKAPPVEGLTPEGVELTFGRLRICDPEAYDAQMRRLLGLV